MATGTWSAVLASKTSTRSPFASAATLKWSRGQVEARLGNIPPCLIGMEACVGAHHLSRKLASLGHDARLMPAKYVRPYSKGQKNDFNDAEAIAEAVQRPTTGKRDRQHVVVQPPLGSLDPGFEP